jgi:putative membrane protein
MTPGASPPDRVFALERPDPALLRYYLVSSLLAGPGFPFLLLYRYFRYHTLRYRFDDEGISMRWGVLFRKEIHLTYARIQDIHLSSNVIERWLGLARIEIQTASGSAKAEMTIEGILEFEEVRDFLYWRMRGMRGGAAAAARPPAAARPAPAAGSAVSARSGAHESPELASVLREVAGELRALRNDLANGALAERRDG